MPLPIFLIHSRNFKIRIIVKYIFDFFLIWNGYFVPEIVTRKRSWRSQWLRKLYLTKIFQIGFKESFDLLKNWATFELVLWQARSTYFKISEWLFIVVVAINLCLLTRAKLWKAQNGCRSSWFWGFHRLLSNS